MVKCPACGFESPDSAQWCDFCKEPFRKASKKEPSIQPPPEKPKIEAVPNGQIPPHFLDMDTGGNIPVLPSWVRYAAWAVLGAWLIAMITLFTTYMAKQDALENAAAARRHAPSRAR
ncbi:MAG TPA: hypothetical protein DEB40_12685 [Elusimicrobia bacterium]|nr:hypothetical protein [Elusimicrobiota bacterium]HBT62590.1 hypothetical protein [Elusimicrobiota bacterium]